MFRKIIFALFCSCLFFQTAFGNIFTDIQIGDVRIKYITYPIGSPQYNLHVVISEQAQDLDSILRENNAISGINGVFFCPEDYRQCDGKNYTINERFVQGEDLSYYEDTGERGVFAWDKDGLPFLYRTGFINSNKRSEIFEGMGNFPILLSSGKNQISYYDAIGLLDSKMKLSLPRHFICSNEEKTEIIFGETSPISLETLAEKLGEIGCYDALNLDAGQSSYLSYNGRNITVGNRKIIDAFVISSPHIDIKTIETKLDILIQQILGNYHTTSRVKTLKRIHYYTNILRSARNTLYQKYSQNIYSQSGEYIGYTSEIQNAIDIKRVYIINSLEQRLMRIEKEIKSAF